MLEYRSVVSGIVLGVVFLVILFIWIRSYGIEIPMTKHQLLVSIHNIIVPGNSLSNCDRVI